MRDQASQPSLTPTETIDAVRAVLMMTPDLSPSNMELAQAARTMRNMVTRGRPRPLHHGCSKGEGSELNDPVLFRDHVEICFAHVEVEAYCLLRDVRAENKKWMICTDRFSRRSRALLMVLI